MLESDLRELIHQGIGYHLEFASENISNNELEKIIVAFANTDGGNLIIGINFYGDDITGVKTPDKKMLDIKNIVYNNCKPSVLSVIQETVSIDDQTVIIVSVPKGTQKPYTTKDGKYYIRSGYLCKSVAKEEIIKAFKPLINNYYDETPIAQSMFVCDFDIIAFQQFLFDKLSIGDETNCKYYAKNFHLINEDEFPTKVTIAGMLFFGKNPQEFLPQSQIAIAIYRDVEPITEPFDKKEINGTIPQMVKEVYRFLKIHLKQNANLIESLMESIINAIAHRDYNINQPIKIKIFSNRVEVHSPGVLLNNVSIDSVKVGGSHVLRNPTIYNLLYKYKIITNHGNGVRQIIREFNNADVILDSSKNELVLILPNQ